MQSSSNIQSRPASGRQHGFDALRAGGMLLVVLLHALAPYVVRRMPGLLWPTFDSSPHVAMDAIFWSIECFIMTLFFAISGYFACALYRRRGVAGFFWNRSRRLLLPLVLATLIILPITAYVWVFGWFLEGKVAAVKLRSFKFEDSVAADFFGFAHLWYLQYLTLYCLAMSGLLALGNWWKRVVATNQPVKSIWIPLLAFLACGGLLVVDPEIIVGFQQSILPVGTRLLYFAFIFGVGVWLFERKDAISLLQRMAWPLLVASVCLFACIFPTLLSYLDGNTARGTAIVMSIGVNIFAWLTTAGLIGLMTKVVTRTYAVVRYLADASFWMYLTHMPIVGAVHILLGYTNLHVFTKLLLASSITVAASLASYQLFVRQWRVGGWLNGGYFPVACKSDSSPRKIMKESGPRTDPSILNDAA